MTDSVREAAGARDEAAAPEEEATADGGSATPDDASQAGESRAERAEAPETGEAEVESAGTDSAGADARDGDDQPCADLARERDELAEELARSRDRHLRLAADFDNFRKRSHRLERQAAAHTRSAVVRPLLDPLDDLLRVTDLEPQNATSVQAIVDGVDLVERKFMSALEGIGVEVVAPSPGDAFDPNTMEAMMRVPAADEDQDDTVAQLFQRGYALREGQLVRPARVSVFKR